MWQIVPEVGERSRPSFLVIYHLFEGYPPVAKHKGFFQWEPIGHPHILDWCYCYYFLFILHIHTHTHRQTHGHMLLCFVFASGPLAYWRVNGRLAASCVCRRFFLRYLWNYSSACDDDDVMPLAGCCYTESPWNIKLQMFNEFEPPLHQEQQLDT